MRGNETAHPESDPLQPPAGPVKPLRIILAVHERSDPVLPFVHALGLAYAAKGELEIVDLRKGHPDRSLLGVRTALQSWGILPAGSSTSAVTELGLKVKKVRKSGEPRREIAKRLDKHEQDLLVIGTEGSAGIGQLFGRDLVQHFLNKQRQTALYVPKKARPFVDPRTGHVRLHRILLPVDEDPSPTPSFDMLQRIRASLSQQALEVVAVHAGDMFPYVSPSMLEGLSYTEKSMPLTEGPVAHAIARSARREKVDLIVMSTNGRNTITKKIVGSVTEQVLRRATCPVLVVAVR